jgi:hypothetical protein
MSMTYQNDPNNPRPYTDPVLNRDASGRRVPSSNMSWGIPAIIAAAVLVFGFIFLMPSNDRTNTASNTSPQVSRPAPTPAPAPVTPAPPTKAPAQ